MNVLKPRFPIKSASLSLLTSAITILSPNTLAQSLDEAINQQLALGPLPCAELFAGVTDNTDRLTGGLLNICSAAVPAGAVSSSGGGGSATPISTPVAMQNIVDAAHGDKQAKDNTSLAIDNKWSLFFTAESESLDRDNTEFEQGFQSDQSRFIFGSSYSPNPKVVYSLAHYINRHKGDYDGGGDFENSSEGARLLSSFRPTENTFINLLAGFDSVSSARERAADFSFEFNNASVFSTSGSARSDYDYDRYGLNFDAGYQHQYGRYTVSPSLGLLWNNEDYGTYSEGGNTGLELTFYDDERESLQSLLGLNISANFGTSFGVLSPQLGFTWHHEFEDDQRRAEVSFTGDNLAERFSYQTEAADSDFFNINAGVAVIFKGGLQGFVNIQALAGHEFYDNTIASLGLRYEL